jgi:hypothetical protein
MIYKGANILQEHKRKHLEFNTTLKQITFPDYRVYKVGENEYYPSVTTILQYMPKNNYFEQWLKDVGHNADIIMEKAGKEGTQVHEAVENLIKGKEIEWIDDFGHANYSDKVWGMICKFVEFWTEVKPDIIATEEFLVSNTYKYAGTVDIVAEIAGERWLLDVKTSNALHKSYDLQLAAYAKAWEEQFNQKIDKVGIIWLKSTKRTSSKKEGIYQGKGWEIKVIDNIEHNFELFQMIYRLYQLENPEIEANYKILPTTLKL